MAEGLAEDDWARPTDCEGWTVRDLVGHVVGAMRSAASMRELLSQQREIKGRVREHGGGETEHMTQVQIDRTADLDRAALTAECRALVTKATAGRRRTPAPMRRFVSIPVEMGTIDETWRLGYLIDVILTRDAWLHRIDLCRAIGADPVLSADHDGRIVADIVAEWARRHGRPYRLVLTGPAGGTFTSGDADAETLAAGRGGVLPHRLAPSRWRRAPRHRGAVLTSCGTNSRPQDPELGPEATRTR